MIVILDYYRVYGAILLGILATTLLSILFKATHFHGIISSPPSIMPTLLQFDIKGLFDASGAIVIFSFLFIILFDSTGTFIGVLNHYHLLNSTDNKGKNNRLTYALMANSLASTAGGMLGTSSCSPYLESAAGMQAGGKTGLTSVVVAILFLCSIFLFPLTKSIPIYATGPALLYVSLLMMRNFANINWQDETDSIPSMLTAIMIPLTSSIADGMGIGVISYVILKLVCRRYKDLNSMLLVLAAIFVVYFVFQLHV